MYTNLFIDLDDTLWDTFNNNKKSLEEVYYEFFLDRYYTSFEVFFQLYHPINTQLWDQYRDGIIDKTTLTIDRFRHLLKPTGRTTTPEVLAFNASFLKHSSQKTNLIPGAIQLLEHLKPHYKMHILSNGFREVQYKKIQNAGLTPYFDQIILSEDAGVNKPHPNIFDYALKKAQANRKQTLMIGDSWEADIQGAHNAQINQIWFNPQQTPSKQFTPTHTVQTLIEITTIL
jgi:putative hydrolase of the HAD superfamily